MPPKVKAKAKPKAKPTAKPPEIEETQESKNLRECFQRADTNGDGFIDASELGEVLQILESSRWTDTQVALFLKTIDTNGDGRIDYNEFARWVSMSGFEAAIENLLNAEPWPATMKELILAGLARNREEKGSARWTDSHQAHPGVLGRQIVDRALKAYGFDFEFDCKYSGRGSPGCLDCQVDKFDVGVHRVGGGVGNVFPLRLDIYFAGDEENPDVFEIHHPVESLQGLAWDEVLRQRLTDGLARTDKDWLDKYEHDSFDTGNAVEYALRESRFDFTFDTEFCEAEAPKCPDLPVITGYAIGSHEHIRLKVGTPSTHPIGLVVLGPWNKIDVYAICEKT